MQSDEKDLPEEKQGVSQFELELAAEIEANNRQPLSSIEEDQKFGQTFNVAVENTQNQF